MNINHIKSLIFIALLLPLLWLGYGAWSGTLGANPIEAITRTLGDWALRFLLLTLTVTPLRRVSGWGWPMRLRRMLGLYAFFYALLHLGSYIVLDQFFYWPEIGSDIIKRPFITIGMASFLMLIPLAVTSTDRWMHRLGRNWRRLHKLVYPIAIGAVTHYLMLAKVLTLEPLLYAVILVVLLLARLKPRQKSPIT
ncbi:MAG: sulfoxide reductase heme-binding subunit YedZ [Gammaproteobacteria bacterium]|nr:sulfoxide reductase heme-binding subunit YedZ [Gammaproteobacteria bacterium]